MSRFFLKELLSFPENLVRVRNTISDESSEENSRHNFVMNFTLRKYTTIWTHDIMRQIHELNAQNHDSCIPLPHNISGILAQ